MDISARSLTQQYRLWAVVTLVEAGAAAALAASLAAGPFSFRSERLPEWLAVAALLFAVYLAGSFSLAKVALSSRLFRFTSHAFTAVFLAGLALLFARPAVVGEIWSATSSIQPFPPAAAGTAVLGVLLLKVLAASTTMASGQERDKLLSRAARLGVPSALLLIGIFQATVYIIFINNPTFRYWGIADGMFLGQGYPLTLTEPGPISAGSPPYVYDLPLFPLVLRLSFAVFGHTSVGVHVPPLIFSILFPLSLYLLIREATGSRITAVLFAALTSSFPFLRFWVLNLPDPDPFFLTSLCLAAYLYLRALAARWDWRVWLIAGIASAVAGLARPEGILYVGCLALGLLFSRPRLRQLASYAVPVALFVLPMAVVWMANFGFIWPQNYNRTLAWGHAMETYNLLKAMGALSLYHRGLGMGGEWAAALLGLFVLSVLYGMAAAVRAPRLLPIVVPAVGNTILLFFTNVWISNAFHYVDFFRHAAFGIPFMVMASAYGFHTLSRWLSARRGLGRLVPYVVALILVVVVIREGDILANPTATHRSGSPIASQALADYPYLSLQTILQHPLELPSMNYYRDSAGALVAHLPGMPWPETALQFFKPLDMSYDSQGRAFGYASVAAFLLALAFAVLAEAGTSNAGSHLLRK